VRKKASRATQDVYSASGFSNAALLPRHFVTPEGLVVAPALAAAERSLSPRERARLVFDKLDTSGDGAISKAELGELLVSWGLPRSDAAACLAEVDGDRSGAIGFDEFFHQLAPVWEFACAVVSSNASVEARLARLLLSGGGAAPSHRGTGGSPAA